MSLNQWVLTTIPTPVLAFVIIGITLLISVGGLLIVRRFVPIHRLKTHNDIAAPMFATLGVIYAVLLAFVAIVVWENFDTARTNVMKEANYLADIYRDSIGLPTWFRVKVKTSMNDYIQAVITEEWPEMAHGRRSPKIQAYADRVWELFASYEPQTETQKIFYAETVGKMNAAAELHRQRLLDANTGIHPVLWGVLIIGGLITIVFTFFFGSENLTAQILMTSLLAGLIGIILFTILVLDFPFSGDVCIKPDVFNQAVLYLNR